MAVVNIPTTYFTQNIKKQYRNPHEALFREFLQNSIDAHATSIKFTIDNDSMTCEDNGCGMDEERLVSAMLTLSGSVKDGDSIGGFGEAKNLLLFAHKSFFIHTKDNIVNGECLNYDLTKGESRTGTIIKIFFHDSFQAEKHQMIQTGKEFLEKCEFKNGISVFLNDTLFSNSFTKELCHTESWCNVYMNKNANCPFYALVRKNGINMFPIYVGVQGDNEFIIELTENSTDCLSSNRDSMNWHYSDKLQNIINKIQMDKNSFGKLFKKTVTFIGRNAFNFIRNLREKTQNIIQEERKNQIENLVAALESTKTTTDRKNIVQKIKEIDSEFIKESVENIVDQIETDLENTFIVDVHKKGMDSLPEKFNPTTMSKKYKTFANIWKLCVMHVLETLNYDINFNIGWVISDDGLAQYKIEQGNIIFQVNPEEHWSNNKKQMVFNLLMAACHEVTHINHKYHDENFCAEYYVICTKVMTNLSSWKQIYDKRDSISF